jgi:hypothetical protein
MAAQRSASLPAEECPQRRGRPVELGTLRGIRQPVRLRRVASDADHGLAGALGIVQHLKDMALNGAIGQGLKVLSLFNAHAPVRSIFQGAAPKLFFGWKGRLSPIATLPPFATIPRMKHPIG